MEALNILIITQAEWTPKFGAVKVHIDIKEEYERQGHRVTKISIEDLYPKGQSGFSKVFGEMYTERIYNYLKKNACNYDVIDANFSCVVYPKESFNFKGVILFRSHGIAPIYEWAEQNIERYKQALLDSTSKIKFKTRIGNIYRALQKTAGTKEFNLSVKYADLVHCLNKAELQFFKEQGISQEKLVLLPNGIPDEFINQMNLSNTSQRDNSLCFVGAWSIRKGISDIDEILYLISKKTDFKKVVLLGGQRSRDVIRHHLNQVDSSKLDIVPHFEKGEFLQYIEGCKVGLFPSYAEGHPLAIIEQLSMGIPVVAYNVPGSSDILEDIGDSLLVEPGDIDGFVSRVIDILNLDDYEYQTLSDKCKSVSKNFLLSKITRQFLEKYQEWLANNEKDHINQIKYGKYAD